jgi:hypothetical protein
MSTIEAKNSVFGFYENHVTAAESVGPSAAGNRHERPD